jgi:hypothetical protein
MQVHHVADSNSSNPDDLATACVACHAIKHVGRNLALRTVEIWKSDIPQVDIVRTTRALVATGMPLSRIKKQFKLTRGLHAANSVKYANDLMREIGDSARAYLNPPLCAVFVKFKRWQIESCKGSPENAG